MLWRMGDRKALPMVQHDNDKREPAVATRRERDTNTMVVTDKIKKWTTFFWGFSRSVIQCGWFHLDLFTFVARVSAHPKNRAVIFRPGTLRFAGYIRF